MAVAADADAHGPRSPEARFASHRVPLVLRHYPSIGVAVAVAALLVALAASSSPFVTTAAASEALKNKLADLTPLATGLEIDDQSPIFSRSLTTLNRLGHDRDLAFRHLAARLSHVGAPILTTETRPVSVSGPAGDVQVVLMARTGALGHVKVLSSRPGDGVWISSITARVARVRAGGLLAVRSPAFGSEQVVRVRVKGVYRALAYSPPDPYWVNFGQDIYSQSLDAPPPPPFVFMERASLYRLLLALARLGSRPSHGFAEGGITIAEFPVEPHGITLAEARALDKRFGAVDRALSHSSLGRRLGCVVNPRFRLQYVPCKTSSSLSAAVVLADRNASAVSPAVTLLSDVGGAIALGVAAAAGLFLVRRRRAEAALLYARGAHPLAFAGRTAAEALLPTLAGGAAGFGLAYGLTTVFAPSGSLDRATVWSALARAAAAVAIGLALLVLAASFAFLHLYDTGVRGRRRRLRLVPWELPLLGVALYLLVEIRSGSGLSSGVSHHPTLPVFVFPLLFVAAAAGLGARLARLLLRLYSGRSAPPAVYLALRRLAAARGLLVVLTVVTAVAIGSLLYAETLASSLQHTTIEKAYMATGSDAQVTVADSTVLPRHFPYPITKLEFGNEVAALGSADGDQADVTAVDPETFAATLHWQGDWGPTPAKLLDQLRRSPPWPLPVVTTADVPSRTSVIYLQGVRVPVHIVGRVHALPLMGAGVPLLLTSSRALGQAAARAHVYNPLGVAWTYVLAKGPPQAAMHALESAPGLGAYYPASIETFLRNPDVVLARHTFSFMRIIAIAAAVLVFVGVLLYLQARQRSQAIASALARRMGFGATAETVSLSFELGAILLFAGVVGAAVAIAAAAPVVHHLDPLPDDAPSPILTVPTVTVVLVASALALVSLFAGYVTSVLARRADVGQALRVA